MRSFKDFFAEVDQSELDHHDIEGSRDDSPFEHIFKDKLRIVIPLKKGEESSEYKLEKALEDKGYDVNLKKGMVSSTVETKKGQQKREMKIGKVLQRLGKKEEKFKELLHWWEKNKAEIGKAPKKGISIIISQSPIDIIRMSDHEEWESCHAPPGKPGHISGYWPSAGQEARTGGAIAYVVKNSDLEKIEDLQDEEIFQDDDRDIKGIEPLERLRLRRFKVRVDKDYPWTTDEPNIEEVDALIPEKRTYGIKHIDFLDTVMDWAKHAQRKVLNFKNPPDFKTASLKGGHYQDTDADDLWNAFFGTNEFGKKSTKDQEQQDKYGGPSADSLDQRAAEQVAAHENNWKHVSVWYEADDYGEGPFLSFSGGMSFEFDLDQMKKIPEWKDLSGWKEGTLGKELKSVLSDVNVSDIDAQTFGNTYLTLRVSVDPSESWAPDIMDQFESFLDDLDTLDSDYNEHWHKIREILINWGYMKDWRELWDFENFKIEGEADDLWVESEYPFTVGTVNYSDAEKTAAICNPTGKNYVLGVKLNKNAAEAIFSQQLHLDFFVQGQYIKLSFSFSLPSDDDWQKKWEVLRKQIEHLDNNWDTYEERASKWWEQNMSKATVSGPMPAQQQPQQQYGTPPAEPQQPSEFKDWFILSELPNI
jgi:hypothetical protein